jgi:hypothetical protein
MADDDKPDVIPFAEHAITWADSGRPTHLGGAAWQPIETAPDDSHRAFIVTDGQYLKKVRWDQDDGCWTERIEGVGLRPLDPQPLYWFAGSDFSRLKPLPERT